MLLKPSLERPEGFFMAVAAEALTETYYPQYLEAVPDLPLIEVVPETPRDELVRRRAAKFIGAVLTDHQVDFASIETAEDIQPIESLFDAIKLAAEGDATARKMIETNVRTDVIERTIKAGHIMKVDLMADEAGNIQQYGQTMESVQANSLLFAADSWQMRQRTEAEVINAFRIKDYYHSGQLEDYSFVVFSQAADNMSETEMTEAGFFIDTMSCAIQVTTAEGSKLSTESAFVAGTKKPGEIRHDTDTLVALAKRLGADFEGKSAAEILNTPLLIPNNLIPNGAVDLVKIYDECAGGTFFGEDKPQEDYLDYREKCKERELMLLPTVEDIVDELIAEVQDIKGRVHAAERLHKLSEKHMVQQAVGDPSINPKVFGPAAPNIIQARLALALGNYEEVAEQTNVAIKVAKSSSCPSGKTQLNDMNELGSNKKSSEAGKDKYGSLTFKCQKGHSNTRPRDRLIGNCKTCGISVKC